MPVRPAITGIFNVNVDPEENYSSIFLRNSLHVRGYLVSVLDVKGFLSQWEWKREPLFLCSNIVEESVLNSFTAPILCSLTPSFGATGVASPSHPIWLKSYREDISLIDLYLINNKGEKRVFPKSVLTCTLVFIPQYGKE